MAGRSTPRWPPLIVGLVVALLAHALALGGLHWAWGQAPVAPQPARPVLLVRSLATLPVSAGAAGPPAVAAPMPVGGRETGVVTPRRTAAGETAGSSTRPPPRRPLQRAGGTASSPDPPRGLPERPSDPLRLSLQRPLEGQPPPADAASARPVETESAATPAPAAGEADESERTPSYRTVIPPAFTLDYRARRGLSVGHGHLRWQPTADGYQLGLEVEADGSTLLTQASRGSFDAAGLAPLRFTDKRLRRSVAAANFQRDVGRITFSGPSTRFPLRAGTQDRLSWLLQIAAIVAAEPTLRLEGARVVMNVVGAHGDAAVWAFVCQGATGDGSAGHLVYRREPRGPYDVAAAVWLDPGNGYLPSQASWSTGTRDDGFELRLQDEAQPP